MLTAALAQDEGDPNWLANPGFEEAAGEQTAPAAWALGMEGRGEGEAVWQKGEAHGGERCLRVRLTTSGDYYLGRQRLAQSVTPGEVYQIHGWYRSDAEIVAHPCVYFQTADRQFLSAWETALPRAQEWTRFRFTWLAPANTARFELQLRAQSVVGTAWFDDVFLGPAAQLEKERRASLARVRALVREGPLQLRALAPSERPQWLDLARTERQAALYAATSVSIFAARGERESFGALVLGLGDAPLTATVSDLTGPGQAVIPATEIRVRWAGSVTARGVAVPDPLFETQPFAASTDGVPMLWVTVAVPRESTPAGDYHATLTAKAGEQTAALPIQLRVYDFELPRTTCLQSSFWLFRHTIRNAYGLKVVPFEFYKRFLDLCLESRLAPIDAAEWHDQPLVQMTRDGSGQLGVDWTEWDRYLEYGFARGMSAFNVADDHWFGSYFRAFPVRDARTGEAAVTRLAPDSQEYAQTVTRFFALAREHFTQRGWAARAYLQAYDEPAADNASLLAEIKQFYALARQGWPGLRTLITATPSYAALQGSIGIWCPLTPHYDDATAAARRQLGEEVWWYVCCAPAAPWANFFLDQPGAAHRVLFWQTFARRADGLLYWGINHWPGFDGRSQDPVPIEKRWPNVPWNDGNRNGDGYFLYPGPDGPLTSLRFEIMRDGVEDYDALRLLAELLQQKRNALPASLQTRAEAALALAPAVFQSMTNYPADATAMVERRREVNALIELLSRDQAR